MAGDRIPPSCRSGAVVSDRSERRGASAAAPTLRRSSENDGTGSCPQNITSRRPRSPVGGAPRATRRRSYAANAAVALILLLSGGEGDGEGSWRVSLTAFASASPSSPLSPSYQGVVLTSPPRGGSSSPFLADGIDADTLKSMGLADFDIEDLMAVQEDREEEEDTGVDDDDEVEEEEEAVGEEEDEDEDIANLFDGGDDDEYEYETYDEYDSDDEEEEVDDDALREESAESLDEPTPEAELAMFMEDDDENEEDEDEQDGSAAAAVPAARGGSLTKSAVAACRSLATTKALPALMLPKLGDALLHAPMSVRIIASAALAQYGVRFAISKNKSAASPETTTFPERAKSAAAGEEEGAPSELEERGALGDDAGLDENDDERLQEEGLEATEEPSPSADENGIDDTSTPKRAFASRRRRKVQKGETTTRNSPEADGEEKTASKEKEKETPQLTPKKQRGRLLRPFARVVDPDGKGKSKTELLAEIKELQERVEEAESNREAMEEDYESSSRKVAEFRQQLASLSRTNAKVKAELTDMHRKSETALQAERQRVNEEMSRVRESLVSVLERERRLMRGQMMRSAERVRTLVKEREQSYEEEQRRDDGRGKGRDVANKERQEEDGEYSSDAEGSQ